jgi:O-antigen/teichoic acid export membrane protein
MFTLSNLLKRGANYLLMVLLVRSVSVAVIGSYAAYINIIGVLLLITNFGFSEYLLVNSEEESIRKENISIFFQISLILFFFILIITLFIPLNDYKLGLLILIKVYLETSIYNILLAFYQAKGKLKIMSVTNIISGISVIIISFIFYFLSYDIYTYLLGINCVFIVIAIIHFFRIPFRFNTISHIIFKLKSRFYNLKYYGISMITIPIYMMAPTVIGSFLLSSEDMAQYQVAFSISNILLLVSVSLLQVGYVQFVELKGDLVELRKALKKIGIKIIGVNLMFLILFSIFGKEILLLVYKKESYLEAYYPLLVLLCVNTIFMFSAIFAVVMVIRKEQREKSKYHMEFIFISISFGFLFTYYFGIYGVVSSYVVLYSYSFIRYLIRYNKIYKEIPSL